MDYLQILNKISVEKDLCEYWDVRIEETHKTEINYEDFELVGCSNKPSLGAFIRVFKNGMWFYSSTTDLNDFSGQIRDLCKSDVQVDGDEKLKPYNMAASTDHLIKFENARMDKVSTAEKKQTTEQYFDLLRSYEKLKSVKVVYVDEYKQKFFKSSTDIEFSSDFNRCGIAFLYTVTDGDGRFDDIYKSYSSDIDGLKSLEGPLKSNIEESHLFVDAKTVEAGEYPIVMSSEVVGVFAHESFGHKSEADNIMGDPNAKEAWKIGSKVGAECLSIVDYGGEPGTSGYCPIDDEGFPTQKTYLIKNGLLTGRLHSQHTSQYFDEAPTGNGRAMNFEFEPIVRMTNTYVEAGDKTFDQLIENVKFGIYAKDFNHGSGLSTFTIAPRKCYAIRDGKIAEPIRASVMSGSVFEALDRIEAVTNKLEISSGAFGGCGKGEQAPLPVAFGGPKVLISKLMVS